MPLTVVPTDLVREEDRYSVQARAHPGTGMFAPETRVPGGGFFMWQSPQIEDALYPWNPIYPNSRDVQLKHLSFSDSMIAAGIYSMKTRMVTLKHKVTGTDAAVDYANRLLAAPGLGDSFPVVIAKCMDDLLTCDNGAFIEKWGPGDPSTPLDRRMVLGFGHLDSRQCWRTYDPEYPVVYTNAQKGTLHKLHASRVVMMSDNPQPMEWARGVGFCAMSRAVKWVRLMRDILTYKTEKVSGRFTRAIGAIKGVTRRDFEAAINAQRLNDASQGFIVYGGIPFLVAPGLKSGEDIEILLQDLASLPDGFSFQDDMTLYAYVLAFVFGVDAREFWPATTSGATKGDASTQNQKAQARGIGSVTLTLENGVNECLPEGATLTYDVTDDEQEKIQLENSKLRYDIISSIQRDKVVSPREARAHYVAYGVLDREILEAPDSVEGPEAPDLELVDEIEEARLLAEATGRLQTPPGGGQQGEEEEQEEGEGQRSLPFPHQFETIEEALKFFEGEPDVIPA